MTQRMIGPKNLPPALLTLALSGLFTFSAQAADLPALRCFDSATSVSASNYQLCVPSITKGQELLVTAPSTVASSSIQSDLSKWLSRPGQLKPLADSATSSAAEKSLRQLKPGNVIFGANSFLPEFITSNLNKGAGFGGPNCFHTALRTLNILPASELRIVGEDEFSFYLAALTERVQGEALPGDLVVYEPGANPGHAAVSLGRGLVFHKKSYNRNYLYRITQIDDVAKTDPFEWEPNPISSTTGPALEGMNAKDREIYRLLPNASARLQSALKSGPALSAEEQARLDFINTLDAAVIQNAASWSVGKNLGYVMESFVDRLVSEWAAMKKHAAPRMQLGFAVLRSLQDQVFQSIEDAHFSSPYASSKMDRILNEICYTDTPALRTVLKSALQMLGRRSDDAALARLFDKMKTYPRTECKIPLFELLQQNDNLLSAFNAKNPKPAVVQPQRNTLSGPRRAHGIYVQIHRLFR